MARSQARDVSSQTRLDESKLKAAAHSVLQPFASWTLFFSALLRVHCSIWRYTSTPDKTHSVPVKPRLLILDPVGRLSKLEASFLMRSKKLFASPAPSEMSILSSDSVNAAPALLTKPLQLLKR